MKKGEKFQIDQKWWSKNKPTTLKSTGLGAVMAKYPALKTAAKKLSDAGNYKNSQQANSLTAATDFLHEELPAAVNKAIKACNKTLHKEALDCLTTTANAVIKAERTIIDGYQDAFDSRYETLKNRVLADLNDSLQACAGCKTSGHLVYKRAEGALKNLAELTKKILALAKAQKLTPEAGTAAANRAATIVIDLHADIDDLKDMHVAAKDDEAAIGKLTDDHKEELHLDDAKRLILGGNEAGLNTRQVLTYHDKVKLFLTTAQSHLAEIEKAAGSKAAGPTAADVARQLNQLGTNLDKLAQRGREINNSLIGWITVLKPMAERPEAAEAAAKIPRSKFAQTAQGLLAQGPSLLAKGDKLLKQSQQLTTTVLKRVPPALRNAPEVKQEMTRLKGHADLIEQYAKENNPARWADVRKWAAIVIRDNS